MPGHLMTIPANQRKRALRDMGRALLLLREAQRQDVSGRAYSEMRRKIADGRLKVQPVNTAFVERQFDVVTMIRRTDMPANRELVRILLETVCARFGGIPESKAWTMIGVTPHRGNNILHRGCPITWPEWCMLWDAGPGPAHHVTYRPKHVQRGETWNPIRPKPGPKPKGKGNKPVEDAEDAA
jgi:hypothetical protein